MSQGGGSAAQGPGRPPGSISSRTRLIQEKLADMGCDPIEGMAKIGMAAEKDAAEMFTGVLAEIVALEGDEVVVEVVEKALKHAYKTRMAHWEMAFYCYKELAQYVAPKRKAIEMQDGGSGGGDIKPPEVARKMALALVKTDQANKLSSNKAKVERLAAATSKTKRSTGKQPTKPTRTKK